MEKHRKIIAIISISVSIILSIFLFNHPDLIKVGTNNLECTTVQNFVKNTAISLFCGSSIYIIFYAIPHEYKKCNKKKKDE